MSKDFLNLLQNNIVYLDGGMGTLLQANGLKPGEYPERWNLSHPEVITKIHTDYFNAGSNVVCTNTFGANAFKFSDTELEEIIHAAIDNARAAKTASTSPKEKYIALDIGPSGKLLDPLGDLDFEDAVSVFAKTIKIGTDYGVDLILIETMSDCYETKAALLAAKETTDLPVLVSNAYGEGGRLMTGASPAAMVAMLEGMGASAIGANCSLGPKQLRNVVEELLENASVPVILKPNAGLPKSVNGKTVFDFTEDEFSDEVAALIQKGVRVVGGCCGTSPSYIKALTEKTASLTPIVREPKNITVASSYSRTVKFGSSPIIIGERINPTGKPDLQQALLDQEIDDILNEGFDQEDEGAQILDINVGMPGVNEAEMLTEIMCELQAVTHLPLQIDTSDVLAMEAALRRYNGKAIINSVNGKKESMEAIFPLAQKYGGLVIALTMDENGIPTTAEERYAIAEKIIATAATYGIEKKDLIFDTLAMPIATDPSKAVATLEALRRIKTELHCHTVLGISNVSFGLPKRDAINSTFFAMALANGLSAAIMNPASADMMKTYHTFRAIKGLDENCEEYMELATSGDIA